MSERESERPIRVKILLLLLNEGGEISVREISRRLGVSSSTVFYHLKGLADLGVLVRRQVGDRIYYVPQPIFTRRVPETVESLATLLEKVRGATTIRVANCVYYFLQCYDLI